MKTIVYACCLLLALSACQKEIEIDYRSVAPLHVIEASLSDEKAEVIITSTRPMEDSVRSAGIGGAVVTISYGDTSRVLEHKGSGVYASAFTGVPGTSYTLGVQIGERYYQSVSVMQRRAAILSGEFSWLPIGDNRILIYELMVEDIKGEDNYFCYRMYRNGRIYRWHTFSDRGNKDGVIPVAITCFSERELDDPQEYRDEILFDGDRIEIEVISIDRTAYDYLYSLNMTGRMAANPVENFTGGALGYFAAYSISRMPEFFFGD
jgi:hypothetical protein